MIFLKGNGVIISKNEIGEADRYITVFMEDFGKVSLLIKGIRKSKRRDKIAVDLISLTNFSFYRKGERIIVSSFNSVNSYEKIKNDLEKINLVAYIFSILNQILVENGKNRKIYNLLIKTLDYIEKTNNKRNNNILILYFLYKIIQDEGIGINEKDDVSIFLNQSKDVRETKIVKEIFENLAFGQVKEILKEEEKYKLKNIRDGIFILEEYINFNLDTRFDMKKFLWGDLLW